MNEAFSLQKKKISLDLGQDDSSNPIEEMERSITGKIPARLTNFFLFQHAIVEQTARSFALHQKYFHQGKITKLARG